MNSPSLFYRVEALEVVCDFLRIGAIEHLLGVSELVWAVLPASSALDRVEWVYRSGSIRIYTICKCLKCLHVAAKGSTEQVGVWLSANRHEIANLYHRGSFSGDCLHGGCCDGFHRRRIGFLSIVAA